MFVTDGRKSFALCCVCGTHSPSYPSGAPTEWVVGIVHARAIEAGWMDVLTAPHKSRRSMMCPGCKPNPATCEHELESVGTSYAPGGRAYCVVHRCKLCGEELRSEWMSTTMEHF